MKANHCPECGRALRFNREIADAAKEYHCCTRRGCGKWWVLELVYLWEVNPPALGASAGEKEGKGERA